MSSNECPTNGACTPSRADAPNANRPRNPSDETRVLALANPHRLLRSGTPRSSPDPQASTASEVSVSL